MSIWWVLAQDEVRWSGLNIVYLPCMSHSLGRPLWCGDFSEHDLEKWKLWMNSQWVSDPQWKLQMKFQVHGFVWTEQAVPVVVPLLIYFELQREFQLGGGCCINNNFMQECLNEAAGWVQKGHSCWKSRSSFEEFQVKYLMWRMYIAMLRTHAGIYEWNTLSILWNTSKINGL